MSRGRTYIEKYIEDPYPKHIANHLSPVYCCQAQTCLVLVPRALVAGGCVLFVVCTIPNNGTSGVSHINNPTRASSSTQKARVWEQNVGECSTFSRA